MSATHINGKQIATKGTAHTAPGPPATSTIPPPPPTGPAMGPFAYIARSKKADAFLAPDKFKVGGKNILIQGTRIQLDAPVNQPSQPLGPGLGGDLITKAIRKEGFVMEGLVDKAVVKGEQIAVTGSIVYQNLVFKGQKVYQVMSAFLGRAGWRAAKSGAVPAQNVAGVVLTDGDPVSLSSGAVLDERLDLEVAGPVALSWRRNYASHQRDAIGALGRGGWSHSYEQRVVEGDDGWELHDGEGRRIALPALAPGEEGFLRAFGLDVQRTQAGRRWEIRERDTGLRRSFAPVAGADEALLCEIRDPAGGRIVLDYDDGRLLRVRDHVGRELAVTWADERVRAVVVQVDGVEQQRVDYEYHPSGELHRVIDTLGQAESYTYDLRHRLVSKELRHGRRFFYAYDDDSDWCLRTWGADGRHLSELHVDHQERRTHTSGTPRPRIVSFDERGSVVSEEAPGGHNRTEYRFDADGLVVGEVHGAGQLTAHERDERGLVVNTTFPGGAVESFEYDADVVVRHVDRLGRVSELTYDGHRRLAAARYPNGEIFSIERDRDGRIVTIHDACGQRDRFGYNRRGELVTVDTRQGRFAIERNPVGFITALCDPLGRMRHYDYDALGRLTRLVLPDGSERRMRYDEAGNLTELVDELGQVTRYRMAGVRSLSSVEYPDGRTMRFEDDIVEALRFVLNGRGERYEFRYDRSGNVIEEIPFDGAATHYRYDVSGELVRIDLEDDTWREFVHDEAGNVVQDKSPHGTIHYQHDAGGQLSKATVDDPHGMVMVALERDAAGRVVSDVQGDHTIAFGYDDRGLKRRRVLPSGDTTDYEYDDDDRLVAVVHNGLRIELELDAMGRELKRRIGERVVIESKWNARDRLVSRRALCGEEVLSELVQRYDARGALLQRRHSRWGETRYRYDEVGRLLEASSGREVEMCSYDAAGYLTYRGAAAGETTWPLGAGNLVNRTKGAEYAYDACHRRSRMRRDKNETRYFWDVRGRLREVWLPDGTRARYHYDAFGRRVRKEIFAQATPESPDPDPLVTTYLWDGDELAAEHGPGGWTAFVHRPDPFGGPTSEPLLQARDGRVLVMVNDHLGQPMELVDAEGQLVWSARLDPWGALREVHRREGEEVSTPFRQLGQYHDDETGLRAQRFRYFDPEVARWLSPDPLGFLASPDLYGFPGAPTTTVDPLGLTEASSLTPADIGRYGSSAPGLERHEILQNIWLKTQGVAGGHGAGQFSRDNPSLNVSKGLHGQFHDGYDPRATNPEVQNRNPTTMMNKAAKALKQAGVPNDVIKEMKKRAKKHAPKWIC
jgi:RHS repeat-associated protein